MMVAIGVDPGATGAIVAVRDDNRIVFVFDEGGCLDDLAEAIFDTQRRDGGDPAVFVERQQYMAKGGRAQGAKSAFSLGNAFGFLKGYFTAHRLNVREVRPQEWQRYHFGSGTVISDPKQRSIREAQRVLPDLPLVPPGHRVPSHGRADAALIALYGLAWRKKNDRRED
jgi:hypothetical protein